ncbi:MXAN_6640 family putative metalloprotease [Nocardioides sp. Root190]|uniref:MXAN_6640 family putative metalloprotease n=1 Tax=Nocardioides sp. Root190 TaxID=1736488 RepID=UPI000A714081|nr:MXAN_6640 family putative metalloprotease [Nocardioides sp. Root190]
MRRLLVAVATTLALGLPLSLVAATTSPAQAAEPRPTETIYEAAEAAPVCLDGICVHYAQDGTNDVPAEDDGGAGAWKGYAGNGIPDYVDLMSAVLVPKAADTFAAAGYRSPVGDGVLGGGSDQVDIYLADLDDVAGGAHCVQDEPAAGPTSGFCVLDNDYSPAEYGTRLSRAANAGLDAVHQYFLLVQWAYSGTNSWLNSASAAWAEDEIYPTLNRNRAVLPYGPMGSPRKGFASELAPRARAEGTWIFLRFLSERYRAEVGGLPVVLRHIWEHTTDPGAAGPVEDTGLRQMNGALTGALAEHGTTLTNEFTRFAFWNRDPARFYREGATYQAAAPATTTRLSRASRSKVFSPAALETLSSKTHRFTRGSGFRGAWRLKIAAGLINELATLDLSLVTRVKVKGRAPTVTILGTASHELRRTVTLPFSASVEWVEVTFVSGQLRAIPATPWPQVPTATLRVAAVR